MSYGYDEELRKQQEFDDEHKNDIIVTQDDVEFHPGYGGEDMWDSYPDLNLGLRRSTVTGPLRARVLERNDFDPEDPHRVEILENHENGGYCGSCAFEYTVFKVLIDGDEVLYVAFEESPFRVFQDYLEGEDV